MSSEKNYADKTIDARLALMSDEIVAPEGLSARLHEIRALCDRLAYDLANTVRAVGPGQYDVGRLIACLDMLKQVQQTACDSLCLPHAKHAKHANAAEKNK